jgi:hypothetical protein
MSFQRKDAARERNKPRSGSQPISTAHHPDLSSTDKINSP